MQHIPLTLSLTDICALPTALASCHTMMRATCRGYRLVQEESACKYPGVRKVLFSACSASYRAYRALYSGLPVLTGKCIYSIALRMYCNCSTCNRLYSCTGTVSSPLTNTVQGPCTCKVPFSDCRTGHIQYMRVGVCACLCLCLCVCVFFF